MTTFDLVVVGGGTAGLVSAIGAAGVGARVALVEEHRPGGDCLWTGCVPSKSLIAAADAAHAARTAGRFGVDAGAVTVDFARVMAHVQEAIAAIEPHDSAQRLVREGVEFVAGRGRFVEPGRIVVEGGGTPRDLRYRRALIATGSAPAIPPVPGIEEVEPLTSDTVWDLAALPERLVVVGGGPIGCELGQAFARLGSQVTLLEVAPRILLRDHADAAAILHDTLVGEGVDVRCGVSITHARRRGDDLELAFADGTIVTADRVLVAAGRRPRTDGLGLDTVGVELTERGHVRVDERLATTGADVFAAGDVTGAPAFTHVAGYHGGLIVQNAILGLRRRTSYAALPAVTYTDPGVAQVGPLVADAPAGARAVRFSHDALDRAITEADTAGFTELVADRRGRLIGATVVGAAAGELVAVLAAEIRTGTRLRTVAGAIYAYPTRAEAIQRAALEDVRAGLRRYRWLLRAYLALRRLLRR